MGQSIPFTLMTEAVGLAVLHNKSTLFNLLAFEHAATVGQKQMLAQMV